MQPLFANLVPPKASGMSRFQRFRHSAGFQEAELIPTLILPPRCSVKLVGMALAVNFSIERHLANDVILEFVEFVGNEGIVTDGVIVEAGRGVRVQ